MSQEFRLIQLAELPELFQVYKSAIHFMDAQGIEQWDDIYPDHDTLRSDIEKQEMYGLLEDGKIVAGIVLNEEQDEEYLTVDWQLHFERIGVIHRLCVGAGHQGRGYGRKIAELAEQEFCRRGFDCIRLDAFPQNPSAMRLYDSLGYSRCGSIQLRKGTFTCFEKRLTAGQPYERERKAVLAD